MEEELKSSRTKLKKEIKKTKKKYGKGLQIGWMREEDKFSGSLVSMVGKYSRFRFLGDAFVV